MERYKVEAPVTDNVDEEYYDDYQMNGPHCDNCIRLMHEMVELDHLRKENDNLNQKLKKYECQITQLESEKDEYKEKYEQIQKMLDEMQSKE